MGKVYKFKRPTVEAEQLIEDYFYSNYDFNNDEEEDIADFICENYQEGIDYVREGLKEILLQVDYIERLYHGQENE